MNASYNPTERMRVGDLFLCDHISLGNYMPLIPRLKKNGKVILYFVSVTLLQFPTLICGASTT
jgi:hypothetical protein